MKHADSVMLISHWACHTSAKCGQSHFARGCSLNSEVNMLYSGSAGPFQIKPLIRVMLFHLNVFETNLDIRRQILILPVFLMLR